MLHCRLMVFSALLLLGALKGLFAQSVWTAQTSGTKLSLNAVTWTGSQLVAVDGKGAVLTSPDGETWTTRTMGTTSNPYYVMWTGNQLVAAGDSGSILTSPDGLTWAPQASGTKAYLQSVTMAGSQLVAVGRAGTILTSPDGVTWTPRASGDTSDLRCVTWTGNQLVAVGDLETISGTTTIFNATILTSPDGITWTHRSPGTSSTGQLSSVTWTGDQLVAVGRDQNALVLTSPDGITWALWSEQVKITLFCVTWTGNQLVAVGGGGLVITSPDGLTWVQRTPGTASASELYSVTKAGGQLVAVGRGGIVMTSPINPTPIAFRLNSRQNLSLRLTRSQLFATLPTSLLSQNTRAAIYNVFGGKVIGIHAPNFKSGITMPISALARGIYWLEVISPNDRIVQAFNVRQVD